MVSLVQHAQVDSLRAEVCPGCDEVALSENSHSKSQSRRKFLTVHKLETRAPAKIPPRPLRRREERDCIVGEKHSDALWRLTIYRIKLYLVMLMEAEK